mgnify:CR=1 FL=1
MQHYLDAFRHYADFSGRATRSDYWFFVLFNTISLCLVMVLDTLLLSITGGFALTFIYQVAMIIPFFALAARRLHDTGRSGWLQLVLLIPLIGFVFWLGTGVRI